MEQMCGIRNGQTNGGMTTWAEFFNVDEAAAELPDGLHHGPGVRPPAVRTAPRKRGARVAATGPSAQKRHDGRVRRGTSRNVQHTRVKFG